MLGKNKDKAEQMIQIIHTDQNYSTLVAQFPHGLSKSWCTELIRIFI